MTTPITFQKPEDICNRALQHVGARRIVTLQDNSKNASECAAVYDRVRKAELRRNCWGFSTRKTALRPMYANTTYQIGNTTYTAPTFPQTGTLIIKPDTWDVNTTYMPGSIVADPSGNGILWTSLEQENLGNAPGETGVWDVYFGPLAVSPYDQTTGYWAGELVYVRDPDSQAVNVYRSLANNNANSSIQTITNTNPSAGADTTTTVTTTYNVNSNGDANPWILTGWNPKVTYNRDQVIVYEFVLYRSATEQNIGNVPSSSARWLSCGPVTVPALNLASNVNWLPISCTVRSSIMAYPIGAGPAHEIETRNAFMLPNGYLRQAPQDPKQGSVSYLGTPSGLLYNDWNFEGKYLTSRENHVILLRFIADITNVKDMDDMFCEGLAARIAAEVCETLTQSTEKLVAIERAYTMTMGEARIVNGIETGSDEPPLDDYIACRA